MIEEYTAAKPLFLIINVNKLNSENIENSKYMFFLFLFLKSKPLERTYNGVYLFIKL